MQVKITKNADHRGQVESILKAPSPAAIRQLTMDNSLDLSVDFTEGGKSENSEKSPQSTGETNYNNSTHMSSKFFEDQHEAIPRWSPIQLMRGDALRCHLLHTDQINFPK